METRKGRIESVESKAGTSPNGKTWTRYAFKIDNKVYSTFDVKIGEMFKSGDMVKITGETPEGSIYFNMRTMELDVAEPLERPSENETFKKSPPNSVPEIKKETGEFQSTVWNHSVAPNSYEVGKAGCRFKLYFESVEELKSKLKDIKEAGLLEETIETPKTIC